MSIFHSIPGAISTDMSAQSGFIISGDDPTQQWYGWKWSREPYYTMTGMAGPMTESQARAWLAEVAG